MKKFYQKYKDWIVICLLALFCLKSCQSCSRSRIINFNKNKSEILEDSLKKSIYVLNEQLDDMRDEIQFYVLKLETQDSVIITLKSENQNLKENNNYFRNANNILIKTNNQIINKEN